MAKKMRVVPYAYHHGPEYETQASRGPSGTILVDDTVLGIGGIQIAWVGMGIAWFRIYPGATDDLRQFWKLLVETFSGWVKDYNFVRVEAHVDSEDPKAITTALHLGFVRESTLKKWGPGGRDHEMMVIIR